MLVMSLYGLWNMIVTYYSALAVEHGGLYIDLALAHCCQTSLDLVIVLTWPHSKAEQHKCDMGVSCGWASAAQPLAAHIYNPLVDFVAHCHPHYCFPYPPSLRVLVLVPVLRSVPSSTRSDCPTPIGPHESRCDRNRSQNRPSLLLFSSLVLGSAFHSKRRERKSTMCLVKVKQEEDHIVPYRVVQRARSPPRRRASRRSRDIERRYSRTEVVHESPRPSASSIALP